MKNKVIIKIKKKLYNVVALPALKNLFRILPIAKNKIVFEFPPVYQFFLSFIQY